MFPEASTINEEISIQAAMMDDVLMLDKWARPIGQDLLAGRNDRGTCGAHRSV